MQSTIYALVDCNNFFVSCERVFNPKLQNRPVIVLSNNDGCAVSRSNEVKKLGIAMGEPLFKIRDLVQQHNIAVLSSNFALYADLSARVMRIIQDQAPEVDIYSIDEAFLNLTSLQDNYCLYTVCANLVAKIERYTGIPVSVGIANTKTLAKVANHIAKQQNTPQRVFILDSAATTNKVLSELPIREIWGIGRRLEKKLNLMGIYTAAELAALPQQTVRQVFNVVLWRTVQELRGIACIELPPSIANKKQIMVSRSFGERVVELTPLQEALATYVSAAAVKLRRQNSLAGGLYVFLHTGLHGAPETVYKNSLYITLPNHSSDTRVLINYAKQGLNKLFRLGYRYQKVGVILCDFIAADAMQFDIFADGDLQQSEKLMQMVDGINRALGKNSVQFAAAGLVKSWRTQSKTKSNNYTNNWHELPAVRLQLDP